MKRLIVLAAVLFLAGCTMLPGPEIRDVCAFAGDDPYEVELVCYSEAVSFEWHIEGVTLRGQRVTHQLSGPGEYVAAVLASDSRGNTTQGSVRFEVSYIGVCYWETEDVWACTFREED